MSERLRRRSRDENAEEKGSGIPRGSSGGGRGGGGSGIPRGSSGGSRGSGGSGIPRGSSGGGGGGGGSGIPRGSSGGGGGGGGNGIPRGSSGGGGGRGGSGIPRGASIRKGRSGGAGIPRGSKTSERDQDVKTTAAQTAIEQKAEAGGSVVDIDVADDDEPVITAIVSATGITDSVGDQIVPGAYEKTLKTREAVPVWGHTWNSPIGATKDIKELMPGDPLLKGETLADGSPWPESAGGLLVKMIANRSTDEGERAYQNIKFASKHRKSQPWSIGFRTVRSTKSKDGTRYIKELDLFEYSPVLHGANAHAKTLSVKSLDEAVAALHLGGYDTSQLDLDSDVKSADAEPDAEGLSPDEVKGLVEAHSIIGAYLDAIGVAVEGKRATVVEGDPDLELPDDDERWVSDGDEDEGPMSLYDELEQLLDPDDFADLLELAAEFDDASDEGDDEAAGEVMGDFLDEFESLESQDSELSALRDVIADVIDDRYPELAEADDDEDDLAEDDDAYYDESEEDESEEEFDDAEGEAEEAEPEPAAEKSHGRVERKSPSAAKRDRAENSGAAMAGGKYPIENAADLKKAIGLRSQGNAPTKLINGHIKKRANALGLTHMLPDDLKPGNDSDDDSGKSKGSSGKPWEKSLPLSEVKALPSMSWGSDDSASLVLSAIDFN